MMVDTSSEAPRLKTLDVLTPSERSALMSRIKSKDTKPELLLRSMLHRLGYRYRLHVKSLPGQPDLVFSSRGKIIFIHGCFWHRHRCRQGQSVPSANAEFWQDKFNR